MQWKLNDLRHQIIYAYHVLPYSSCASPAFNIAAPTSLLFSSYTLHTDLPYLSAFITSIFTFLLRIMPDRNLFAVLPNGCPFSGASIPYILYLLPSLSSNVSPNSIFCKRERKLGNKSATAAVCGGGKLRSRCFSKAQKNAPFAPLFYRKTHLLHLKIYKKTHL